MTFEGLTSSSAWTFQGPDGAERVRVRSRLSVTTADAAIAAAIGALGVTQVLSHQIAEALAQRLLVPVLTGHEPPPVPVSLIYPGQGRLPMKTRDFVDVATTSLRERLAPMGAGI